METSTTPEPDTGTIKSGGCEFCDRPGTISVGSFTCRAGIIVCDDDDHFDAAIWGGDPR